MQKILIVLFSSLLFFACGDGNPAAEEPAKTVSYKYPSIDVESMKRLFETCNLIDIIFYEQDFSMNLSDKNAILQAINQISRDQVPNVDGCKATGRIIYQSSGEIIKEADFYFEPNCYHFVFIENDKPVAANRMTQEGVGFFNRLLSGVKTQPIPQ